MALKLVLYKRGSNITKNQSFGIIGDYKINNLPIPIEWYSFLTREEHRHQWINQSWILKYYSGISSCGITVHHLWKSWASWGRLAAAPSICFYLVMVTFHVSKFIGYCLGIALFGYMKPACCHETCSLLTWGT